MWVFQNSQEVLNFFDDRVVHGKYEKIHNSNLWAVLKVLLDVGLTLNPDNCKFAVKELMCVVHHISSTGTRPSR
jgi:hypothetical protein